MKPTRWLSNSPYVLNILSRRCARDHHHQVLIGGRAQQAQVYPEELCCCILKGLRRQLNADGILSNRFVGSIDPEEENLSDVMNEYSDTWGEYYDVSGNALESSRVREARAEEIQGLKGRGAYTKVPIADCWAKTGKGPIQTRSVDLNKGDNKNPVYRSRLVATEVRANNPNTEMFAGMPPLEAKKALFSMAATKSLSQNGEVMKLGFIDVSKAYLYAKVRRDVYVQIPREDPDWEPGYCGKLAYSLYGTRDAAANWEAEYTSCLEEIGFKRGRASPCCFWSDKLKARIVVHGDDFTILASERIIRLIADRMSKKYKIKLRDIIGPDAHDDKEIIILNRILRWSADGLELEADPRHAEIIIQELSLHNCKAMSTPGVKGANADNPTEPLNPELSTRYRALVARANYLSQDRTDIQYAVKELARRMSAPSEEDWVSLKRLGRYLAGAPRMSAAYPWQSSMKHISVWCDSDWAGCLKTRRSTTGGVLYLGSHVVKTWSVTQANVALSSGEAEYTAAVKGCSQALGFRSILADLGRQDMPIECNTDSTAALGIMKRTGLGKVRHLAVHLLWLQEHVRNKDIKANKVDGTKNQADMLTKHIGRALIDRYLPRLQLSWRDGRAESAPAVLA